MTTYQNLKPVKREAATGAHLIQSDAEALAIAHDLSQSFKKHAVDRDAQRILPFAEIEAFSQSGLWGISVPKIYGGAEVSSYTVAQVIALFSGVDGSIGQIPQNHFYALEVLRNTGSAQQQQRLYAEVLAGARFGNALAEFNTRDALQKTVSLRPAQQGGYLIDGTKFYCTGSLFAHRIPTLVSDAEQREFLAFIPSDAQGVEIIDDWYSFGQKISGSGTVKFNQAWVAAEDVIAFDLAFSHPTLVGPFAQLLHASIEVGIARAAFEETLVRVRQARPWIDATAATAEQDPLSLYQIGRISSDVRASELLLKRAAQSIELARPEPNADNVAQASIDVAKARAHSSETALQAASKLIELAGSRGSHQADGLDRYWRNARVHTLHDPTRWKYYFIGDYVLNGQLPPRRGTL